MTSLETVVLGVGGDSAQTITAMSAMMEVICLNALFAVRFTT
jgi:hypothetical protein